jgi:hypothetical protein
MLKSVHRSVHDDQVTEAGMSRTGFRFECLSERGTLSTSEHFTATQLTASANSTTTTAITTTFITFDNNDT